jgi:ubiquitin-protein ligase
VIIHVTELKILLILVFSTYRVPGINAVPHEDNLRYFDVSIHGPAQSPYEGMHNLRVSVFVSNNQHYCH